MKDFSHLLDEPTKLTISAEAGLSQKLMYRKVQRETVRETLVIFLKDYAENFIIYLLKYLILPK